MSWHLGEPLRGWLRAAVAIWVKATITPSAALEEFKPAPKASYVYVYEDNSLIHRLIVEHIARSRGMPAPDRSLGLGLDGLERADLSFRRVRLKRRTVLRVDQVQRGLAAAIARTRSDPDFDLRLIPVSVFLGRARDRQSGWFSVLFTETWGVISPLRRLLSLVLNGRNTVLRLAAPIVLREFVDADDGRSTDQQRQILQRVLRVHFRRVRAEVIGADLSHRRNLIDQLLRRPALVAQIQAQAQRSRLSEDAVRQQARAMAWEIAADYSPTVVRSASFALRWFWNRIYAGIALHHFEPFQQRAIGHEVVYVPCHRSHIDYLLLSYVLYQRGLVCPHIVAGINLNLPLVGPLLRRGGAIFMRRSFKASPLYAAVFGEYLAMLIAEGVAIEYFVEGGRSRTGRVLDAKLGLLSLTVRAYLKERRLPLMFQPVYIGYERLVEGRSYIKELTGAEKRGESLWGLLRSFGVLLRQRYGSVAVSFGEPVKLEELLDREQPDWREQSAALDGKPAWLNRAIERLSERITVEINRAANVNPVNLLALALWATPKQAIDEHDLREFLGLCQRYLSACPYSPYVSVTPLSPAALIKHGLELRMLSRIDHPLGPLIALRSERAVLDSYFRNNVLHLFAALGWIAAGFLNNPTFERRELIRLGHLIFPFLRSEFKLCYDRGEYIRALEQALAFLVSEGLLQIDDDGLARRPPGGTRAGYALRMFGQALLPSFQRYYITLMVLVRAGSGQLSAAELESRCHLVAQRLTLLFEFRGPEFFDRALFRGLIQTLRSLEVVRVNEDGKLDFEPALHTIADDAKRILSKEVRHGIQIATEVHEVPPSGSAAAAEDAE